MRRSISTGNSGSFQLMYSMNLPWSTTIQNLTSLEMLRKDENLLVQLINLANFGVATRPAHSPDHALFLILSGYAGVARDWRHIFPLLEVADAFELVAWAAGQPRLGWGRR